LRWRSIGVIAVGVVDSKSGNENSSAPDSSSPHQTREIPRVECMADCNSHCLLLVGMYF